MYLPSNKLAKWRNANKPKRCPILDVRTSDWVVDHDHRTGMVRGVISRAANSFIGKVENFLSRRLGISQHMHPEILRAAADYLERKNTDILHPVGLRQLTKRFRNNLTSQDQQDVLKDLGASQDELELCTNAKKRSELFRRLTKKKYES